MLIEKSSRIVSPLKCDNDITVVTSTVTRYLHWLYLHQLVWQNFSKIFEAVGRVVLASKD